MGVIVKYFILFGLAVKVVRGRGSGVSGRRFRFGWRCTPVTPYLRPKVSVLKVLGLDLSDVWPRPLG